MVGTVAHPLADDGHRHIEVACHTGPGVACHIGGEGARKSDHATDFSQAVVDILLLPMVLAVVRGVVGADDGQHVGTVGSEVCIAVDNLLRGLLPRHGEVLARFAAAVGQGAGAEVGLAEVGHVDKGHAAHEETEEEDVACEGQRRAFGQGKPGDGLELALGDGALDGGHVGQAHTAEELPVDAEVLHGGLAELGFERAQVEADGVELQLTADEPCLVAFDEVGGELVEGEVGILPEFLEPAVGLGVGHGGALALHFLLLPHLALQECEYGGALVEADGGELPEEFVEREVAAGGGHVSHDSFAFPEFAVQQGTDAQEQFSARVSGMNLDLGFFAVPFVGIDVEACARPFHLAAVDDLEVEGASGLGPGGGTEFDFYRCHLICLGNM